MRLAFHFFRARCESGQPSTAEVREEPEEEKQNETQDEAGDDGEIEGGVFTAVDDVAGEAAETKGEFSAKVKKGANSD